MNDLYADIGYRSINHVGETLCGDHVEIVEQGDESRVIVLADGLGSGVKASILSTLTSRIISTMMAEGMSIEDCVSTITATLPVCSERDVAYSTFTIIRIIENRNVEIMQYDNPMVIYIRDGEIMDYPRIEMNMEGKRVYKTNIRIEEGDLILAVSDGCPHAGIGNKYNFGWQMDDIADYMKMMSNGKFTAKTLATMLIDEVNKLYGEEPGDDATACVVKVIKREPVNILFGPPSNKDDCNRMMNLFFSKKGKHIVSGGTTASIVAGFLKRPLVPKLDYGNSDIPPIAEIDGVDLVTEGVITMNRVVEYAGDYVNLNEKYEDWACSTDGASLICRILFEEATDINFFVGRAINPAHQNPDLPINFSIKMNLVEELSKYLKEMGKRVQTIYF
ncbi:SpoIIE family protein phosphatase [Butyrivibrio sp. MC2013]|uniref:SpoIIE family protein phosphatase n=1 Tax=Butyrivibrio sp. MC2013 TaxID=1280686 RepID=UPI0004276745|nr:SpoIIE family protein phosphatase [Butyrivibrio sp. MC2013]